MSSSSIKKTIVDLLKQRDTGKTICPSEVARLLYPEDWREHMEEVRAVGQELVEEDVIEITQKGFPVTPPYTGPIRLRLKKSSDAQ